MWSQDIGFNQHLRQFVDLILDKHFALYQPIH